MTPSRRKLLRIALVTLAGTVARSVWAQSDESAIAHALPARILYEPNASDLPDQARAVLDGVAAVMRLHDELRIELVAYASGPTERATAARHLSLVRAVYIRNYLMEHSIASTRIDLHPLGRQTDGGPADRVDIAALD